MIGFFPSIARFAFKVEGVFHVRSSVDLPLQFLLGPSEPTDSPDVPSPLLDGQLRLQDDQVLCPANSHRLGQYLGEACVGAVKLSHPAQIPGGEPGSVRICGTQVFCRSHRRALLRSAADQPANLAVQFHLRQSCRHQLVQRGKHGAVVHRFPDVHRIPLPFPAQVRLFLFSAAEYCQDLSPWSLSTSKGLSLGNVLSYCLHINSTICSHWMMNRSSTTQLR